jgi:hypothetical protein
MADAGSSSRSHNSVTEPTYLLTQVSVNKQDIAVLTELGRNITVGEMKSIKPTTSFVIFHQVIRDSMAMQRFVDSTQLQHMVCEFYRRTIQKSSTIVRQ